MKILDLRIFIITILMPMFLFPAIGQPDDYLYDEVIGRYSAENPIIFDTNFQVEEFSTGLSWPTTMTIIDKDILVSQKNDGQVRHVLQDGTLLPNAVIDVEVSNYVERGLLGITSKNSSVYLYYTESNQDGGDPIANNIYKYKWDGTTLQDPVLVKSLPSYPEATIHQGGVLVVGKDGTVYAVIGDQDNQDLERGANILQNQFAPPDDTGVILPVDPTGVYHAIGIRNSFGLAIDPVTGNMWATENGADRFDEVNLVLPKFNSGWNAHTGPIEQSRINVIDMPAFVGILKSQIQLFLSSFYGLFVLTNSYEYSEPEFSWESTIAPTGLDFAPSSFGKYGNWLFVGDCNFGQIYKFKLNSDRDEFVFEDSNLHDLILNNEDSIEEIIFGGGFGCITDIEFSDNTMYVTSLSNGIIYKIFLKD